MPAVEIEVKKCYYQERKRNNERRLSLNTQQLESFIQVAENLNFARASEYLNITQSAVSRQIHALEEELQTKLFYRTTRTVSLTPEGLIFLEHAKQILGQLKMAAAKIQHHSNTRAQVLTIGCESETDLAILCGTLRACKNRIAAFHPLLKLIAHRSLLNLFYHGEIDLLLGFQDNLPTKNDMVFRELGKIPLCAVFPREHPSARRSAIDEQELYAQPFVLCSSYTIPAKALEIQNRVAQHTPPELVRVSEHPQAIFTLIRAGYGCSILPKAAFRDSSLAYVPLRSTPPLAYGMLYSTTSSNPILKQFVDLTLQTVDRSVFTSG